MPLDIFPEAQSEAAAYAETRPSFGPGLDVGGDEAFLSAFGTAGGFLSSIRVQAGQHAATQSWISKFRGATGWAPPNPEEIVGEGDRTAAYGALQKAYQDQKVKTPDLALEPPPTEEAARQQAIAEETARQQTAANVARRPASVGSRVLGAVGSFAGSAIDPINLASMPLGVGEASSVLSSALRWAALGGGASAVSTGLGYSTERAVNPNLKFSDAALAVAGSALAGGILGGGVTGLARLWGRARPPVGPRYVEDAGNVVDRAASVDRVNPAAGAGIPAAAVHAENYRAAEDAIAAGQPVALPQESFSTNGWRPSRVFASDGSSIDVKYELAEAGDLITSHNDDFGVNPAYPPELQPRDRARPVDREQVSGIANGLQPERLGPSPDASTGAPIVGPDDIVESGNGRVLALRQAAAANGPQWQSYINFLKAQGFDPERMDLPVLVGRRVTQLTPEQRIGFSQAANRATAMRLSVPEQALADARLLDAGTLGKLASGDIGSAENRAFVRSFLKGLPRSEHGGLIDRRGQVSAEGIRRVQAALLARAYGDPTVLGRVLEDADSNVRGLGGALTDAAGAWAGMREAVARGEIPPGMDITPDLLDAFRLLAKARDEGMKLADLLDQTDLLSAPSLVTKMLLGVMHQDETLTRAVSRAKVAAMLRDYAEEAGKNTTDARLFGEPLGQRDVLSASLAKSGREDLIRPAEEAITPEAIDEALRGSPEQDAAVEHRVEQMQDNTPDVQIPWRTVDADGNETVTMRPVKDLMADADREIAASKEIEACSTGGDMAEAAE